MKQIKIAILFLSLFPTLATMAVDKTIFLQSENLDEFVGVSTCLMNKKGEIFAFSPQTFKIFKFKPDGAFEKSFCNKGEGPGEIRRVFSMFYNPANDCLHLPEFYSQGKGKVAIYDSNGNYKGLLKANISLRHMDMIQGLYFLEDGSFYLTTSERVGWEPEGKFFITQEEVFTRFFKPDGECVAEIHKGRHPGEFSSGKGWGGPNILFAPKYIIRLTHDQNLAVIRNDENVLNIFNKKGQLVKSIAIAIEKEKVTTEEFNQKRDEMVRLLSSGNDPRMTTLAKAMIKLDYKPFFSSMLISGKYIILTKTPGETEENLRQKLKFFDMNGRYLGQKELNGVLARYADDYLIIFQNGKNGEATFRIEPNNISF